ncbi:MAG: AAA family ATPase [Patescibacteria group bacterium]
MSKERHIIGLTGLTNAGKGEIARIMHESHEFEPVSLSTVLKQVAEEHYGTVERGTLERVYKELGEETLAERVVLLASKSENNKVVIDSIRSIKLLDAIKSAFEPDFTFVGVAAPRTERFTRLQDRARLGDPQSWEEFIQLDLLQLGDISSELLGYQVRQCFLRVDIIVRNNSKSITELEQKVVKLLDKLDIK